MRTDSCLGCDAEVRHSRQKSVYCSATCWWDHCVERNVRQAPHGMRYGATCEVCHGQFQTHIGARVRKGQGFGSGSRFCSQVCQWISLGRKEHECQGCGTGFYPKHGTRVTFCSRECSFDQQKQVAQLRNQIRCAVVASRRIRKARRLCKTQECKNAIGLVRRTKHSGFCSWCIPKPSKATGYGYIGDKANKPCDDCGVEICFVVTGGRPPARCKLCAKKHKRLLTKKHSGSALKKSEKTWRWLRTNKQDKSSRKRRLDVWYMWRSY
jgi:hypothetical protein